MHEEPRGSQHLDDRPLSRPDKTKSKREAISSAQRERREEGRATDADDVVLCEVRGDGREAFADHVGFICLVAMGREAILVRVDGDARHAQLVRGAEHSDRDFLRDRRRCGVSDA